MKQPPFKVVGIGASAGGIEAFRGFFDNMAPNSGFCFVVILHLAPDRRSLLTEILARWTAMPVITAEDGMVLGPDEVFVIPPGRVASIENGALHLREAAPEERLRTTAIDVFFDSLAAAFTTYAIGIVLSGTGHDGALGLKAIREAGGMTLAQGPNGSAPFYAGMPDSAVATGAVDLVIPVEAMPAVLVNAQGPAEPARGATPAESNESRLEICRILLDQLGHDFSQYKNATFMRRVHRRMQMLLLADQTAYIARLREDREECVLLFRDLLIGVTSFFRDSETFAVVARDIIPGLFAKKGPKQAVRVWVAGCATGEEAYSIAILLREYADSLEAPPTIQVFATDMDEYAIAAARAGRYPSTLLKGMARERVARFFTETEHGHVVVKAIRDICTFSPHSLIRDPPFSRVDLISCRNLLIYLDNDLQAQVIPIFHYALSPGGVLLLGSSETVSRFESLFTAIDKKHRIFRRNDVPSPLPRLPVPSSQARPPASPAGAPGGTAEQARVEAVIRAKNRVLDTYSSAYVVVSAGGEILHYSARTGRFFEPASGPPSKNLFEMARPNVRLGLRAALRRAGDTNQRFEQSFADSTGENDLTILVEPLLFAGLEQIFLVVFLDPRTSPADILPDGKSGQDAETITAALERENRDLREQLQSIREEHETALEELRSANEELHSLNEELQSSNEELETSREEIQSVNEEMSTVNAQLAGKVDELDRANSDLRNLFESTKVATIFLDPDLIIRAFTPDVTAIYNLIPGDIGRPLADIVNHLNYRTLRDDVAMVLETSQPMELRVARDDGAKHYLMRILPYDSPDSSIDGTLITYIDVTTIVQAEQHQRLLVDELNHRVKNMLTVVISLAAQTLRRAASLEEFSATFLGRVHALAKAYELLSGRNWEDVPLRDIVEEELRPFLAEDRVNVTLEGSDIALDARGALAVGMALHELTTNAVKYGALSVPEGHIMVSWKTEAFRGENAFVLLWTETNGPAVTGGKPGFGILLIERGLSHDLAGEAHVTLAPGGVQAILRAPIRRRSLAPPTATGA
jgi:two-component system CheB/CheR fusion protein